MDLYTSSCTKSKSQPYVVNYVICRPTCYKSFSVLILNMEQQNSIDITVKTENLISAVQNEPSIWNTKLNSSEEEKDKRVLYAPNDSRSLVYGLTSSMDCCLIGSLLFANKLIG